MKCFAWWICLSLGSGLNAAEPEADPAALPRVPSTSPQKALETFKVKPGFKLELVAAEPLVVDPVALSFDEDGALYVVEMRDYSERREERLGRVRRLVDTDGDGHFDQSTVFVDGLAWPTAVFCYDGGIFVAATPDIFFCRDTNGDGKADTNEVIFSGFASDYAPYQTNRLNVQAMLNSFVWGLDNRIHGATSMNGGQVKCLRHPERPAVSLRGRDFSFDPRTFELRAESGGGQHGMSFDNAGRKFICSNSSHCQAVLYEDRYAAGQASYPLPPAAVNIAIDGPAAEVFRISPDEPWRVLRTRWRVAGLAPGPIEGGGRPSGYFTGASGITIYRGNAWPTGYVDDAFIADCGSNLIHHKRIHRGEKVEPIAQRAPDETITEFLASTDNWFRPVQFANAPDGTLYIADMYREVIEHPWSLPPGLKRHLDLNSGNDRGRIYRLVPAGFKQLPPPRLSTATTAGLVSLLDHNNGWHRDAAARLLYERNDPKAAPALEQLASHARTPLGRLHALSALHGIRPSVDAYEAAMADPEEAARVQALRLWEVVASPSAIPVGPALQARLETLAADPHPRVRYQLALTLGVVNVPFRLELLARLAGSVRDDRWLQASVLSAVKSDSVDLLTRLTDSTNSAVPSAGFLRELARRGAGDRRQVERTTELALRWRDSKMLCPLLVGLGEGLDQKGGSLFDLLGEKRSNVLALVQLAVQARNTPLPLRQQAIQILGWAPPADSQPILTPLLQPQEPQEIQLAAVAALAQGPPVPAATILLAHYPGYSPRLRREVVSVLLSRRPSITAILSAIETDAINRADLNSTQIDFLRRHQDEAVRRRAETVLGPRTSSRRGEVVRAFSPVLQLNGVASQGQRIYLERCASCHRLAGQGHALGPDLESVRGQGREVLLGHILDPNREVAPAFLSYELERSDGEFVLGIMQSETSGAVVLRQANGQEKVVPRAEIVRLQSQGLSAMPEGLEEGLSLQEMADLLAYLSGSR